MHDPKEVYEIMKYATEVVKETSKDYDYLLKNIIVLIAKHVKTVFDKMREKDRSVDPMIGALVIFAEGIYASVLEDLLKNHMYRSYFIEIALRLLLGGEQNENNK